MDRVEIQTDNWKLQLDRLVNTYLIYRQLDHGDGLPEVPDSPEDGTSLAPFMIELLDSYCSYPVFFIQRIDVNECLLQQIIHLSNFSPSQGNFCE